MARSFAHFRYTVITEITMRVILIAILVSTAGFGQVSVVYTGRTLGYLRFPDKQAPDGTPCDSDPAHMPEPAKGFYNVMQKQRGGVPMLTVGMGDNFGPNLYAKAFEGFPAGTPPEHQIPYPGKDLFVWDFLAKPPVWVPDSAVSGLLEQKLQRHEGVIPRDNVGCFMRAAEYDALVPGQHDFGAGPEHLIVMARFLMSDHQGMHKAAMLGANIGISTAMPDARPRVPLYQIEHDFEDLEAQRTKQKLPRYSVIFPQQAEEPTPRPALPDVIFPWQNEVVIKTAFFVHEAADPTKRPVSGRDLQGKWNLLYQSRQPEIAGSFHRGGGECWNHGSPRKPGDEGERAVQAGVPHR